MAAAAAAVAAAGFFQLGQSVALAQQGLFENIDLLPLFANSIGQGFDLSALIGAEFFKLLEPFFIWTCHDQHNTPY